MEKKDSVTKRESARKIMREDDSSKEKWNNKIV